MPAGTNCHIDVIRLNYNQDDDVGGAQPSGTYLHRHLETMMESENVDSTFFQQGLESIKTFSLFVWGHNLQIREQDEIVVASPPNHPYYGKYFRVVDVRYDSRHPGLSQNYVLLKVTRSQVAHAETYQ